MTTSKTIVLVASGAPKSDDRTAANIPSVDAMADTMPTATWRNAHVLEEKPDDVAESGDTEQSDGVSRKAARMPRQRERHDKHAQAESHHPSQG